MAYGVGFGGTGSCRVHASDTWACPSPTFVPLTHPLEQEMRRVVDALERLNDYMVGHIRYEEEVTMPWLRQASGASAGVRRPPIAV